MKSIALRPWELAAYMRNKKLLVVRPFHLSRMPGETKRDLIYRDGIVWAELGEQEYDPHTKRSIYGAECRLEDNCMFYSPIVSGKGPRGEGNVVACPFGKPGEVLGIKEPFDWAAGSILSLQGGQQTERRSEFVRYRADGVNPFHLRWTPARNMPDWLIRHRPTIADIRVMRVGEISEEECRIAGCHGGHGTNGTMYSATPTEHFRFQWRKDHGKGSLVANPWCWGIELREGL